MGRRIEQGQILERVHTPVHVEDRTVCNSFGVSIFMAATSREAEDLAKLINLGAEAARKAAAPIESKPAFVPRDGDAAHRAGFRLEDNPFAKDGIDANRHLNWADDWQFRHDHCGRSAPDGPGQRLDPARPR